jgi:hypothetical protein
MYGLIEDQLKHMLNSGSYQEKLLAIDQLLNDRSRHLNEISPIPRSVMDMINAYNQRMLPETEKLGLSVQKDIHEYQIVPAALDAIFRGNIGKDCSSDFASYWALNPDNYYMIIKKGGASKGYIGMTSVVNEQEKYLLIDTLQPCPPAIIEPILRTINEYALKLGYKGLVIGTHLDGSFNYAEVKNAINKMPQYSKGEVLTVLEPEHSDIWQTYINVLGKDSYHSLSLNKSWKILKF